MEQDRPFGCGSFLFTYPFRWSVSNDNIDNFDNLEDGQPSRAPSIRHNRPILTSNQLGDISGAMSDALTISSEAHRQPSDHPSHYGGSHMFGQESGHVHLHQMATHLPGGLQLTPLSDTQQSQMMNPFVGFHPPTELSHDDAQAQHPSMAHLFTEPQTMNPQALQNMNNEQYLQTPGKSAITVRKRLCPKFLNSVTAANTTLGMFNIFNGLLPPEGVPGFHPDNHGQPHLNVTAHDLALNPNIQWGSDVQFQANGFVGEDQAGSTSLPSSAPLDLMRALQYEPSAPNTQPPSPRNMTLQLRSPQNPQIEQVQNHMAYSVGPPPNRTAAGSAGARGLGARRKRASRTTTAATGRPSAAPRRRSGRANLSTEEKKRNHNASEKIRRDRLSRGFERLYKIAPSYDSGNSQNGRLTAASFWVEDLNDELSNLRQQLSDARVAKGLQAPPESETP